jgi:hypothetical protein
MIGDIEIDFGKEIHTIPGPDLHNNHLANLKDQKTMHKVDPYFRLNDFG